MKRMPLLIILLLIPVWAWGANLYVDNDTIESGATWDGTNGHSYECAHGSGTGYSTVQAAVTAMSGGDDIYIRGGTYTEQVFVPSGRSGTVENYSSLQSYPGEWAIIDNNHRASSVITGYDNTINLIYNTKNEYWLFERLEITGGGQSDFSSVRGAGIWHENAEHCVFRYLYVHHNYTDTNEEGSAGGIVLDNDNGAGANNNLIEYCYLKGNGNLVDDRNTANAQIAMYADYRYANEVTIPLSKNEIRYCLLDAEAAEGWACVGIVQKGFQRLTGYVYGETGNESDNLPNDGSYQEYGDKYHHNIIRGGPGGIRCDQDYVQVYNNIIDINLRGLSASGYEAISTRDLYQSRRGSYWPIVYNNTILANSGVGIMVTIFPDGWNCSTSGSSADIDYSFTVNNVVSGSAGALDWEAISINSHSFSNCTYPSPYTLSRHNVSRNLIYNHTSYSGSDILHIENSDGNYTASEAISAGLADVLWSKNTPSPFAGTSGADKYKTTGSYSLDETYTIANGGIGGDHPYLSGVTIPSYVGAVNPSDTSWVAGVLALDASYMTSATAGSDPSWIEGSGSSSPTTHRVSSGVTRRGVGIH